MVDRSAAAAWYRRNRARSRALFDLLEPDTYYSRPIALRHPVVFYEGHLPAFSFNTLVKRALGGPGIDARLETLFARGIDPHESTASRESAGAGASASKANAWPSRDEVHAFAAEADRRVLDALAKEDLERPGHPLLDKGQAVFTILEHEAMHHETLLYMWHRLAPAEKRRPAGYAPRTEGSPPRPERIEVPGGCATLGVDPGRIPFGWDNEFPARTADVPSFIIDRYDVTNAQYLEFVDAGGYAEERWWTPDNWRWVQTEGIAHPLFWVRDNEHEPWHWRGMFDRVPLPASWPVYVSHAEASAYTRWRGSREGIPMRLPTEAEYQRAAFGAADGERAHPWGSAPPSPQRGVFDFCSWDPEPVGSHPGGQSAWAIDDLVGNGWEWTGSVFAPFPGFRAMPSYPEYSADFFDGEHMVMKGASPATAAELLRPTFRNWFRPRYPYVYATFRCVTGRSGR